MTCDLCGADDTRLLYESRDYRLGIDDRLWRLVRCRRCGLGYLNPRPTPEESLRYYPPVYFAHRGASMLRYERQAAYVSPEPVGRLLDIGAARGEFMEAMRRRGWEVAGVEPAANENPHSLEILHGRFPEDCTFPRGGFDVVTAWAVFEHLHRPTLAFQEVGRLLRPGGAFLLQVPNLRSVNTRLSRMEDIPRHLYFFDPTTLRRYGEASGLHLEQLIQVNDLGGGNGRGALQLGLVRALGGSVDDFFAFYKMRRRDRFEARFGFAAVWTALGAIERLVLSDRLLRITRLSGQVLAVYRRPADDVDPAG